MKQIENTSNFINDNFIPVENIFKDDKYLTSCMRYSIFEKILTKYIFQYKTKQYNFYGIFSEAVSNKLGFPLIKQQLENIKSKFEIPEPLNFFSSLITEIWPFLNRLQKDAREYKNLNHEDQTKKIEYLLSSHFENNFYLQKIVRKLDDQYFNDRYIRQFTEQTNFNYSISSLGTLNKFLQVFEKQSLYCRHDDKVMSYEDGFLSEKKYYYYLDNVNKDKVSPGNFVEYIIKDIERKCEDIANDKVNNYQVENYISLCLFVICRIVKNFSFYFDKKPELENIFLKIKKFRK